MIYKDLQELQRQDGFQLEIQWTENFPTYSQKALKMLTNFPVLDF